MSRLCRSRTYHIAVSGVFLVVCLFSPYSFQGSITIPFWVPITVAILSIDAVVRYFVFGLHTILGIVDVVATSICANFVLFDAIFAEGNLSGLRSIIVAAAMLRCIMAAQHSISYKSAIQPVTRKLLVEEKSHSGCLSANTLELDLCFLTSRVVVVSKSSLSSAEHVFLEAKYSNFLRRLPQLDPGSICSVSVILSIVESAARHLFSNPVNVVSVIATPGDPCGVLIACAILLRVGIVYPRTSGKAIDHFLKQRFAIEPYRESLLPKCLESQLGIIETIMTRKLEPADIVSHWYLKRVVLSNFDPESFLDLKLLVIDIDSGEVVGESISASATASSLTFICTAISMRGDALFILLIDDEVVSKLYVNPDFHFERVIASNSSFHYVSSTEQCDHWADRRFSLSRSSARIEIVASQNPEVDAKPGSVAHRIDKSLLQIPSFAIQNRPSNPNCLIV